MTEPTFVTTPDGVVLAVHEWGNPAGPPVLLIHGQRQCQMCFDAQREDAALSGLRMVAYDIRGHGLSDKPLDPAFYHDTERWAAEVETVMRFKELQRPVVAGWSLGGRIIGQYLIARGDSALGGINFIATRPTSRPELSGIPALGLPVAAERDMASEIAATAAFLRACFHRQPTAAGFETALAYNMAVPPAVIAALRAWPPTEAAAEAALRAVRVPVLITHGRQDTVVLPAAADVTAELIGGAKLSWYDDVGHSPFAEDPARFNHELAAFVRSIPR